MEKKAVKDVESFGEVVIQPICQIVTGLLFTLRRVLILLWLCKEMSLSLGDRS